MFLSPFGIGSRMVITGDITQIDLPRDKKIRLVEARRVLAEVEGACIHIHLLRGML